MLNVRRALELVKAKKPHLEKGSAVAKRAVKKPFESKLEKHKKHKKHKKEASSTGLVKACRIKSLKDREQARRRDEDRRRRRRLAQAERYCGRVVGNDLSRDDDRDDLLLEVKFSVTVGYTEHPASMCDSVTGDNGVPDDE